MEFELDLSQPFSDGTLNKYPPTIQTQQVFKCYHHDKFYSLTIIVS